MDRRIETRVVDTGDAELTTLIQKDACEVYWIVVSNGQKDRAGVFEIYDGFDTGGKLKFRSEAMDAIPCNFIPPIPCEQGLAVYNHTNVACYTIGYCPRSLGKPIPNEDTV